MPKQKKQYTLEEVAEKLRELNSQPIPYRRMMVTDHGRRAGMKYFRKGSAWKESLKRLYEEDRERRMGRDNRVPVAAPTATTTAPLAAPSVPTQVANSTSASNPFFFENNDGYDGDDGLTTSKLGRAAKRSMTSALQAYEQTANERPLPGVDDARLSTRRDAVRFKVVEFFAGVLDSYATYIYAYEQRRRTIGKSTAKAGRMTISIKSMKSSAEAVRCALDEYVSNNFDSDDEEVLAAVKPLNSVDAYVKRKKDETKGNATSIDRGILFFHKIKRAEEEKAMLITEAVNYCVSLGLRKKAIVNGLAIYSTRSGVRQLLKEELTKVSHWEEQAQKFLMKFIRTKRESEFQRAFEYLSTAQQTAPVVGTDSDVEEEDDEENYEEEDSEEEDDDEEDLMD